MGATAIGGALATAAAGGLIAHSESRQSAARHSAKKKADIAAREAKEARETAAKKAKKQEQELKEKKERADEAARAQQKALARRRRGVSPYKTQGGAAGLLGQAPVEKKTLLGE